jgi:ADP-dependent phosphofructokinase/glucokinase
MGLPACMEQKYDEGKVEGKTEIAKNLLAQGIGSPFIAKVTGLSKREIESFKR